MTDNFIALRQLQKRDQSMLQLQKPYIFDRTRLIVKLIFIQCLSLLLVTNKFTNTRISFQENRISPSLHNIKSR